MSFKKYMVLALASIVINLFSLYNVVFSLWTLIMMVVVWFIFRNKEDAQKPNQAKRVTGFVQSFILGVLIFISSVMGAIGFFTVHAALTLHYPTYRVPLIIVAVIGLAVYYYFVIRLLLESIRVTRNKGHDS